MGYGKLRKLWLQYNLLSAKFTDSTIEEVSQGLFEVWSPNIQSTTDNYIALTDQEAFTHLISSEAKINTVRKFNDRSQPLSIALFPNINCEENIKRLSNIFFERSYGRSEEVWVESSNKSKNLEDILHLLKINTYGEYEPFTYNLPSEIKVTSDLFSNIGELQEKDLHSYKESFILGFAKINFIPPDSTNYADLYLKDSIDRDSTRNIAIGIRHVTSGEISACSFLLYGKANGQIAAILHGDTVIPNHTGKGLQRYTIAIRSHIANSLGADSTFAFVEPNSASYNNYSKEGFTAVAPPISYLFAH